MLGVGFVPKIVLIIIFFPQIEVMIHYAILINFLDSVLLILVSEKSTSFISVEFLDAGGVFGIDDC